MSKPQLIIAGSIAIDRIMNFSGRYQELLQAGSLDVLSLSVLVDRLHETRGGIAPNITHALAALGEKPILLGSIGQDHADYLKDLARAGIETKHVHVSTLPTASFTAFTDADNNQMAGFYPGAMADSARLSLTPWSGQDVLVCLSAHDPLAMRRQAEECAEHNLRLFYDPGQQVSNVSAADLRAGVKAAEVVAVNEFEQSVLCSKLGITPDELAAKVPLVVVTRGEKGSLLRGTSLEKPVEVKSAKPLAVLDPTGAGDAYRAGFLFGYLRQWGVKQCAQLGSVTASFVLEGSGPQVPLSLTEIIERYEQTYNEEVTL